MTLSKRKKKTFSNEKEGWAVGALRGGGDCRDSLGSWGKIARKQKRLKKTKCRGLNVSAKLRN